MAYLVLCDGNQPSLSEIRRIVGGYLPDYMVPRTFASVDSIPTTDSGKVNYAALAMSVSNLQSISEVTHSSIAPRMP